MSNSGNPQVGLYRQAKDTLALSERVDISTLHCQAEIQKYAASRIQAIVTQSKLNQRYTEEYSFGLTDHSICVYDKHGERVDEFSDYTPSSTLRRDCKETLAEVNRLYLACHGHSQSPTHIAPQQPDSTAVVQQALNIQAELLQRLEQYHAQQNALLQHNGTLRRELQRSMFDYRENNQQLQKAERAKDEATKRLAALEQQFAAQFSELNTLKEDRKRQLQELEAARRDLQQSSIELATLQQKHQTATDTFNTEMNKLLGEFIRSEETSGRAHTTFMEEMHRNLFPRVHTEATQELEISRLTRVVEQAETRLRELFPEDSADKSLTDLLANTKSHLTTLSTEKGDLSIQIERLKFELQEALARVEQTQKMISESNQLFCSLLTPALSNNRSLAEQLAAIEEVLTTSARSGSPSTTAADLTSRSQTPSSTGSKTPTPPASDDDDSLHRSSPPALAERLRQTLAQHRTHIGQLEERIAQAERNAQEQKTELDRQRALVDSKNQEIASKDLEIKKLNERIAAATRAQETADTQIRELKGTNTQLTETLSTKTAALTETRAALDELQAERRTIAALLGNPEDQLDLAQRTTKFVNGLQEENALLRQQKAEQQALATRAISILNGSDSTATPSELAEVAGRVSIAFQEKNACIALLEEQLTSLKAAQDEKEARLRTLDTSLRDTTARIASVEQLLESDDLPAAITKLQADLKDAQKRNSAQSEEIETTLVAVNRALNVSPDSCDQPLAERLQALIKSREDLSAQLTALESTTEASAAKSEREISDAQDLLRSIAQELKHTGAHADLPGRVTALNRELAASNQRADKLQQTLDAAVKRKTDLEATIHAIHGVLPSQYRTRSSPNATDEAILPGQMQNFVAAFDASVREAQETQQRLQKELNQALQQLAAVRTELSSTSNNVRDVSAEKTTLQGRVEELGHLNQTLTERLAQSEESVATLTACMKEKDQVAIRREDRIAQQQNLLEEQTNTTQALKDTHRHDIESITRKATEQQQLIQNELDSTTKLLREKQAELANTNDTMTLRTKELKTEIANLRAQVSTLKGDLAQVDTALVNANGSTRSHRIENLFEQISSLRANVAKEERAREQESQNAQAEIHRLNAQLEEQSLLHAQNTQASQERIAQLEKQLADVRKAQQQGESLSNTTIQELQANENRLTREITELRKAQERAATHHQEEIRAKAGQLASLQAQQQQLQRTHDANAQELQATRANLGILDNTPLSQHAQRLKEKLDQQEQSITELMAAQDKIQREMNAVQDALVEGDTTTSVVSRITALHTDKQRLSNQISELERKQHSTNTQYQRSLDLAQEENTRLRHDILTLTESSKEQERLFKERLRQTKQQIAALNETITLATGHSTTDLGTFVKAQNERIAHLQAQVAQLQEAHSQLSILSTTQASSLTEQRKTLEGVNAAYDQLQDHMNSLNECMNWLNRSTESLMGALVDLEVDLSDPQSIQDLITRASATMDVATGLLTSLVQDNAGNDDDDDISGADASQHSSNERSPSTNGHDDIAMLETAEQIATLLTQPHHSHLRLPEKAEEIIRTLYHVNCILQNDKDKETLTAPHHAPTSNRFVSTKERSAIEEQDRKLKNIVPSYMRQNNDPKLKQGSLQTAITSIEVQYHRGPKNSSCKAVDKALKRELATLRKQKDTGSQQIDSFANIITDRAFGPILTIMASNLYDANRARHTERSPSAQNTAERPDRRVTALHSTLTALYNLLPSSGNGTGARSSSTTASPSPQQPRK